MDRDDVLHKMSKKVAQLTKVIFHLNTRNDEADAHLEAVKEAHEKEVAQVLNDANANVRKLAQALGKARSDGASKQVEALKGAYEDEKRTAARELQDLRSTTSAREQKNTAMWTEKLRRFSADVVTVQEKASAQTAALEAALRKAGSEHGAKAEALAAAHKAELARLLADHEAQFQAKDAAHREAEAASKLALDDLTQHLSAETQRCNSIDEELRGLRRQLELSLSDSDGLLKQTREERDSLAAEVARLKPELERLKAAAAEGLDALRAREAELESLRQAGGDSEQGRQRLQNELAQLRLQLQASETQLAAARTEREEMRKTHERERDVARASHEKERNLLEEQIRALQEKEAKLRRESGSAGDRIEVLEKEAEQLRRERDSLQQRLQEAEQAHQEAAKKAEADRRNVEESFARVEAEAKRLQAELLAQAADFERKLLDTGGTAAQELAAMRSSHAAELDATQRRHEAMQELRLGHESSLAESLKTHAEERTRLEFQISDLRRQLEDSSGESKVALQEREAREAALRQEVADLTRKLSEAHEKSELDQRTISTLEAQLSRLKDELSAREAEAERFRKEHDEAIRVLKGRLDEELSRSSSGHREELERLREELRRSLAVKEREFSETSSRLQDETRQVREASDATIRDLRKKMDDIENGALAARSGAELEVARLQAEMHRRVEEAKEKGVKLVTEISEDHKTKFAEAFSNHQDELQTLQKTLSKSHQERVDDMRAKREAEVGELKARHEAQIRGAAEAHAKQLAEMAAKHVAEVHRLEEEAAKAAALHAAEVRRLGAERQEARESLAEAQATSKRLEASLREAEANGARLDVALRTAEREHGEAVQKKDDDFAREKRGIKEQHKAELERLLEEQIRETGELKAHFEHARQLQDTQIDLLHQRVQELQELYDSRPSREEDVERIRALEAEIAEKEVDIKRLMDEMQFYKLELVNREQNYNKMFGASPLVGTLNPMASVAAQGKHGKNGPPQMRIVQQPGAAMMGMGLGGAMGLPPLGGLVGGGEMPVQQRAPGVGKKAPLQKRPSSGSIRRQTTGVVEA